MHVYSKNNPEKSRPDQIFKQWILRIFEESCQNKNNNNKVSSDMTSVPDPKITVGAAQLLKVRPYVRYVRYFFPDTYVQYVYVILPYVDLII